MAVTRLPVAVVVPCYNDGATLPETVRSVLAQEPVELVVVDDGSDDPRTTATLEQLAAEGVRVLRQENGGVAAARMAGARATTAPYVFALDADDVLLPGALRDLADALDTHPEAVAAWGDTRFFGDVDLRVRTAPRIDPWRLTFANELPAAALFRRDALVETGGWSLKDGYEDWSLWMALAERGWEGVHIGREVNGYRVHGRRAWRDAAARHDEIVAELRRRHAGLFERRALNRRCSSSSRLVQLTLPVVERLPLSARVRLLVANLVTRPGSAVGLAVGLRMTRARRRLAETEPAVSAPGPNGRGRSRPAEVVVVGAGPYGLSAAAHLLHAGVPLRVFGEPMESWERHMPAGMLLRSHWAASQIAHPERSLSLDRYHAEHGLEPQEPLPIGRFVDYGRWFQRHAVSDLDRRRVRRIGRHGGDLSVELDDGELLHARRVVVATGIVPSAWRPPEFDGLPAELVSHAADQPDLARFAGLRVAVVGGGQSALESAAILAEAGAQVAVLMRAGTVPWLQEPTPTTPLQRLSLYAYRRIGVGGPQSSWLAARPSLFRKLPRRLREDLAYRCVRPAGAAWLRSRLADVPLETGLSVRAAARQNGGVALELDDRGRLEVDHVLLATGYRIDLRHYGLLAPELVEQVQTRNGHPILRAGLESSVPGLHFLGAPAAETYGPVMRFVCGTWFSSRALTREVTGRRTRGGGFSW